MRSILSELIEMLAYCRPHGSETERAFIDRYVAVLPGATRDPFGNWHVQIGTSPILWSSHTDTVHWSEGLQTVHYDQAIGVVSLSKRSKKRSHCLGADCTAGVWIMRQMILAGVPGAYVFHAEEECGANGSNWLAANRSEWLQGFTYAIAFDRRGTTSIITEQRHGRTASDLFALSLSEELARVSDLKMIADPRGIFTDTAEYSHLIAECSNLSVGYEHEHSKRENLNTVHLLALYDAIVRIDQSALVSDRTPEPQYEDVFSSFTWPDWLKRGQPIDRSDWRTTPINAHGWKEQSLFPRVIDRVADRLDPLTRYEEDDQVCEECGETADYCECYCEECGAQGSDCECKIDRHAAMYLDPLYEDVQNALRRKP